MPGFELFSAFNASESRRRTGVVAVDRLAITVSICVLSAGLCTATLPGQVLTVGPEDIPRQYLDFHPTNVALSKQPIDSLGRQQLFRVLDAEQGFSIRPLVRGHHGLVLHANGTASPSGSDYARALRENGISVEAGKRVVITSMIVDRDRIIFELNGGPDHKHRFLRHIEIGTSNATAPLAHDDGVEPVGSRVVLVFDKFVPSVTGEQVEQLLSPLIDFAVKSPTAAYVDTLPPKLKQIILAHQVLVGMNREMVLAALGPPPHKSREREGDMPFEEWIYGEPPKDVQFVRINGNRVIRVELAKAGHTPVIRADNEMGDYWATAPDPNRHEVAFGDAAGQNPDKVAAAPPSLRKPGESLPADQPDAPEYGDKDDMTMKKVHFPKPDPSVAPVPPETPPQQLNTSRP
ncbi:MAG TPA: hypothetical protein VGD64_00080 [Acidisarcina sp.]